MMEGIDYSHFETTLKRSHLSQSTGNSGFWGVVTGAKFQSYSIDYDFGFLNKKVNLSELPVTLLRPTS